MQQRLILDTLVGVEVLEGLGDFVSSAGRVGVDAQRGDYKRGALPPVGRHEHGVRCGPHACTRFPAEVEDVGRNH